MQKFNNICASRISVSTTHLKELPPLPPQFPKIGSESLLTSHEAGESDSFWDSPKEAGGGQSETTLSRPRDCVWIYSVLTGFQICPHSAPSAAFPPCPLLLCKLLVFYIFSSQVPKITLSSSISSLSSLSSLDSFWDSLNEKTGCEDKDPTGIAYNQDTLQVENSSVASAAPPVEVKLTAF
ncbi:Hypothetical predicted protein [Podarcis lilfordi]|uniref:Uncharacterized protein n=1 Tax=Podarcis lilfordi TaxID=74358 RepID=A0AA35KXH2_9SAUR|nr:Hypothetical predicted protein [Podarcis lilfordi]